MIRVQTLGESMWIELRERLFGREHCGWTSCGPAALDLVRYVYVDV